MEIYLFAQVNLSFPVCVWLSVMLVEQRFYSRRMGELRGSRWSVYLLSSWLWAARESWDTHWLLSRAMIYSEVLLQRERKGIDEFTQLLQEIIM